MKSLGLQTQIGTVFIILTTEEGSICFETSIFDRSSSLCFRLGVG